MTCACPEPELCARLGSHLFGRPYELYTGKCPPERPCTEDQIQRFRASYDKSSSSLPYRSPSTTSYPHPQGLGDTVEKALTTVGITKDRVEYWLGQPCGCEQRREKLNALGSWAKRILSGKVEQAKEFLDGIISHE